MNDAVAADGHRTDAHIVDDVDARADGQGRAGSKGNAADRRSEVDSASRRDVAQEVAQRRRVRAGIAVVHDRKGRWQPARFERLNGEFGAAPLAAGAAAAHLQAPRIEEAAEARHPGTSHGHHSGTMSEGSDEAIPRRIQRRTATRLSAFAESRFPGADDDLVDGFKKTGR